ncbi:MAG: hypothetical protein Sv326_1008 [Candidatus Fermentimicrarchaeum limneticum]|uniref:Uncharacterized protein n=1 Tax=Fermentimicrarchaeum limneticum TaxID=2795018 RepID=A0A7D6BQX3_FERL1|nr:MAG: hypothetical protein Sv326_1008 [Candidatus Fermentimicrarchaeum limneticum]
MAVKLEERYTLAGHPLQDFKIDEKREFVKGKAGPFEILVDVDGTVSVIGKSAKTNREWSGKYHKDNFSITVHEGNDKWYWLVYLIEGEPHFPKLQLVDTDLFRKAGGKGEVSSFLSFDGVKDALRLRESGMLKLAELKELDEARLEHLTGIINHEAEIREACQLVPEAMKIKDHPEVISLAKEKGLIREKFPLTGEQAEVLSAIKSINESGRKADFAAVAEWFIKKNGGKMDYSMIYQMGFTIGTLDAQEYTKMTKERGRVLTDLGREELRKFREKPKSYIA